MATCSTEYNTTENADGSEDQYAVNTCACAEQYNLNLCTASTLTHTQAEQAYKKLIIVLNWIVKRILLIHVTTRPMQMFCAWITLTVAVWPKMTAVLKCTVYKKSGMQCLKDMKLITIDSEMVPTLNKLQSRACNHLNLLMHRPSAASGKYLYKSFTLPRDTRGNNDRTIYLATNTAEKHSMAYNVLTTSWNNIQISKSLNSVHIMTPSVSKQSRVATVDHRHCAWWWCNEKSKSWNC